MIPDLYTHEEVIEYLKPKMKQIILARRNRLRTDKLVMPSVFSLQYSDIWNGYIVYYYGIRCCTFDEFTGDILM